MKFQITQPMWKVGGWLVASFLLVVSFQNCGKAGFDSGLDELASTGSVDANLSSMFGQSDGAKVQAAPFAFDTLADQITYNSCTGSNLAGNPNGFFTFKIGAYTSGGVRIRQSFRDYLSTNFQPVYPATELSVDQIKNYIYYSPENQGAMPEFAIRTRGNPQILRTPSGTTAAPGVDFMYPLADLTNDRFMDPLVKAGSTPLFFFPFAMSSNQRFLESSIAYNTDEVLAQNLRNDFRNTAQLALTYSATGGDAFAARLPIAADGATPDTTKAYGRGYNLTFSVDVAPFTAILTGNANANPHTNNPNNILTSVQEVNLENPSSGAGATWSCSSLRRYVIIRSQDANLCPKDPVSCLTSGCSDALGNSYTAASYRNELQTVRRHLRPEDWDVSIRAHCVVPKTGSCYPTEVLNGAVVQIQYDQTQECFQGVDSQAFDNPAAPPTKRCAHYVSICTRN
jgi:hypothetical protein